jgi:uncharacterized protein (UPF0332 family)
MNAETQRLLARAQQAMGTAKMLKDIDPDASASRAYYAAFYAVSALFAERGRQFMKHTGVEAAVHRDLVKAGIWAPEIGVAYSNLLKTRVTADYGGIVQLTPDDAGFSLQDAQTVLDAVNATLAVQES